MTQTEIVALVTLATAAYPASQAKDPAPIVNAWKLMLPDIPFALGKAAVIKVCRSSSFFPSVAEIAQAAEEMDPQRETLPTAAEAWEEVARLIRNIGPQRAPAYSCDTVRRAVQAIGWLQLCTGCNPEADRAHFLRIYESMRSKHRDTRENAKSLEMAGMHEMIQSVTGKLRLANS